ncbi:MAG: methionine--tRNA ligase [Actinobacteria bacterium]|nr:methionine--tRNA ligase [Actinomycetota bacterium]
MVLYGTTVESFYITTPIYYVNDAPHIGHAYTMVIADSLARVHRMMGDDVYFITGTDEHGKKVAEAASSHGVSTLQWTDQMSVRFRNAWAELNISNNEFIRTTEPRHYSTVQNFFSTIKENGYIFKGTFKGLYCVGCESYKKENELDNGKCREHGRIVEEMEEENYFFDLPALESRLLEWYENNPEAVVPVTKRNEAVGFIKGGLEPVSITRTSLTWGVPVPWDSDHVFYVWSDALVNYLTAIGYGSDASRMDRLWPSVHHVIGKDILRFHCVWWPAMCMAAGIDPPHQILVHGWLLVSGEKMSKSKLNQIAPGDLTDDFGVDAVRYHLLREVPLGADGDFSYEGMTERYNADLANNLGNLLSRVVTVVNSKCDSISPPPPAISKELPIDNLEATHTPSLTSEQADMTYTPEQIVQQLAIRTTQATTEAMNAWGQHLPHNALRETLQLVREVNSALEATEPWRKEPGSEVNEILGSALEALRIISLLVAPAMPETATAIWNGIGLSGSPETERLPDALEWGMYPGGIHLSKVAPLFPRIKKS